jgi:hypothetical protein
MTPSKNVEDNNIQEDSEQAPKTGTAIAANEEGKEVDELGGILPEKISQILPKETRRSVEMMMQMSGPIPNPVTKKITAEHISRIIEVTEASEMRQHEDQKDSRRWLFAFCLLGVFAFLFLVVFLADKNKDLLLELLKLFITFLGGLGAGWGIKAYKDKDAD